jgi:hypothetical protein
MASLAKKTHAAEVQDAGDERIYASGNPSRTQLEVIKAQKVG